MPPEHPTEPLVIVRLNECRGLLYQANSGTREYGVRVAWYRGLRPASTCTEAHNLQQGSERPQLDKNVAAASTREGERP